MNNFRLDRRSNAMPNRVGANGATIVPGNSTGSRLYLKLIGKTSGLQMPPTGPLSPEQIEIVKSWIDQGAEWPDAAAGETPASPPDQKATQIINALRNGDHGTFLRLLRAEPKVANLRGPGDSTPLMYAELYGEVLDVRELLKSGGDPNLRNEVGATALMWALDDPGKTELLLKAGADANARSGYGVTPLIIAAGRYGSAPVVKLLLDHGADPSTPSADSVKTPLSEAARVGDEAVLRLLIEHRADVKTAAPRALLTAAIASGCIACMNMFLDVAPESALTRAMAARVARGDTNTIRTLLDRGADANASDPLNANLTPLMIAAMLETAPVEVMKSLIDHGASIDVKNSDGETALDFAKRHGDTPLVALLKKSGAKEQNTSPRAAPKPVPASSGRAAIERSIPLLQRSDAVFFQRAGCVSCHNNSLTAMMVAAVRKHGLPVNEEIAASQRKAIALYIDSWRERGLQGIGIPGSQDTTSYILLGLAAENSPPDEATDALARYLKNVQAPDGHWRLSAIMRPPVESSDFQITAVSMRAIQVYAPKSRRAGYDNSVQRARSWLSKASPWSNEDRAFQLLGLSWAAGDKNIQQKAARDLIAQQRPDGGWAQLPWMASDAYATGQTLVALKECGALDAGHEAYNRGIQFLLRTQMEDGSWYVKSRAVPIQPYFDAGFPYGHDQWISAAATNWAVMALAPSAR
jgi:ankyrin repeat protein